MSFYYLKEESTIEKIQEQRSESDIKSKSMWTFFPNTYATSSFYNKMKDKPWDVLTKTSNIDNTITNNKSK